MELIRARTKIPTPKIFGYELEDTNIVGASFMLMEYLPGTSGMDAEGGFDVHRGQIPFARRDSFYREIAGIQVRSLCKDLTVYPKLIPFLGSTVFNQDAQNRIDNPAR